MVRKKHIKLITGIFIFFMLSSAPVFANTVFDIFNIVRRQMMRNDEIQKHIDVIRDGSDDIKKLAQEYKCEDNGDFDKKCNDWALDDTGEKLDKPQKQMENIRNIIGVNEALGEQSIAYQYLRCIAGTKFRGIKSHEMYEVVACKDIPNWEYNPIMVKGLAEIGIIQNIFAPNMRYYVADNNGQVEINYRPVKDNSSGNPPLKDIASFIRKNMVANMCNSKKATETRNNLRAEVRNILAQSYAVAVASRRAGEIFYTESFPYMQDVLLKDSFLKLDTLRKGIHLWIAADSSIIWQLGQLNAVQGLITALKVLNNLGGIRTFDGQTSSFGARTQKEMCNEGIGE